MIEKVVLPIWATPFQAAYWSATLPATSVTRKCMPSLQQSEKAYT